MTDLIVHADWGSDPKRRWMCVGRKKGAGYQVDAPVQVGPLPYFWRRLQGMAEGGSTVAGFDFPIGIPSAYAERAGIKRFPEFLGCLGKGDWSHFYRVCESQSEISPHRPFYPYRPGGTKREYLLRGLGLAESSTLLRRCERATATRGEASPLFWTLGGKQVGKAAIIGWRDLIAPAFRDRDLNIVLWPFDGSLFELIQPGRIVVVETYPAEACVHLGIPPPGRAWSKTDQKGRASHARSLMQWADRRGVALAGSLLTLLETGFGQRKDAEDPFDAMLGAFSMIDVMLGHRPEGVPEDSGARNIEGWILGQIAE